MQDLNKRRVVDLFVEQFWKNGYLTISRKFGTYLPEPKKMGEFDIDIIARYKKDYAIGIALNEDDLDSEDIRRKLMFLSTRQTSFSNKKVLLFAGVPEELLKKTKLILETLDAEIRNNIKLVPIVDKSLQSNLRKKRKPFYS